MNKNEKTFFPLFEFAVNRAGIGIHAIDKTGRTVIYNDKMKAIEGLELEEVGDRSILELFNFDQEESTLLKVLQSGQEQLNVKQTYWNRKGTEITTINDTYPVFHAGELIGAVEIARDITALEKFVLHPLRKNSEPASFGQIIAASEEMKTVISTARKASVANLPVLLIGESGTGKDLIAESIHNESSTSNSSYYTFFGHQSDASIIDRLDEDLNMTKAFTLFCERIDLLSISLQQKLYSFLKGSTYQGRQFIASIGDDPVELIAKGTLLKELYYFFASFTIRIAPLRKRKEDILPFVSSYLAKRKERFGSSLEDITSEVEQVFLQYDWPGNMRELEFLLDEVSSLATTETVITYDMLPLHFRLKSNGLTETSTQATDFIVQPERELMSLDRYLKEAEEYYLLRAMKIHDENITKTAQALGMSRQNLQYRLRKYKNGR
ncbi:sigma 54-interacting transcriptional regulator [Sporosarcina highlanderae]|uniref:Sigma 54-interacting transcriptional regulator n=1 Tax=Sporosarcina highlanderae TaxID=3035916 RepID=A0ABT8JXM0_9BACL|nr:sigma 54-interacting transcriptional regulator [Sporosarcina highlanderae]MDN4609092.1 sigma 54-interacting transcriptional regulator [Sporosarcina highlanderae]